MKDLFHNIRFYVLTFNILLSLLIFIFIKLSVAEGTLQTIRLTQTYAFAALTNLYLALLVGPLTYTFQFLPFRGQILKARRAIGVSAFYYALLHGSFAFFGQLGGFKGLAFLNNTYLLAITLSFIALVILAIMAATSFDSIVAKLSFRYWKMLHRLVYLAGFLILIHALLLGTHFTNLSETIPVISFSALAFLLILESLRIDHFLQTKLNVTNQFGLVFVGMVVLVTFVYLQYIFPKSDKPLGFGIHSQHIQFADQSSNLPATFPTSRTGDPNKRFTVSLNHPEHIKPGEPVELSFQVFDANSGNPVQLFNIIYEKKMHLIIVDSSLSYYEHIHPEQEGGKFTAAFIFPQEGRYHLYLDFQPLGATEQQFAFTLDVGDVQTAQSSSQPIDTNLNKIFDNYQVELSFSKPLKASELSQGLQKLTFTIKDRDGKPVNTLKPYLASFGHLVMINQKTYDYIHIHPYDLVPPKPDQNGGPVVEFLPIGMFGPIKPGVYRVFAQFNPDNNLILADFTVSVE